MLRQWEPCGFAEEQGSAVRTATAHADAHPRDVVRLIAAEAEDTMLTGTFSANWPGAPHRVLRSRVEAAQRFPEEIVGERIRPWASDVRVPVPWLARVAVTRATTGELDAVSIWAGNPSTR